MLLFSIHIEQINDHSNFLFANDDVMGFNMSVGRVSQSVFDDVFDVQTSGRRTVGGNTSGDFASVIHVSFVLTQLLCLPLQPILLGW